MGFCARQSIGQLAPFVASLRHITFAGDVCIVAEDMAAETIERLRALGVIVERAACQSAASAVLAFVTIATSSLCPDRPRGSLFRSEDLVLLTPACDCGHGTRRRCRHPAGP